MQHVLITFGTRPEAIKMAPVVKALEARPDDFEVTLCVTAQHRGMLDQVLEAFDLRPDVDLDLMTPGQTPAQVTSRVLESVTAVLEARPVDAALVHGDTTTAMATALAAFYRQVPVGHVEAGLRSGRMDAPFPEEMNRVVIDRVGHWLFAPTPGAAANLEAENAPSESILVTGNTAIDALLDVQSRLDTLPVTVCDTIGDGPVVLITAHRRESFGAPLTAVFEALEELARAHPGVQFVYPVHPNPNVLEPARRLLKAENLICIEPVGYADLVWLLCRSVLVLTDSGGIQEEGATLGRPVLVLREVTERPELVEAGAGLLVGTDRETIVREATRLLADEAARRAMGRSRRLFGDGRAGARIAACLAGERVTPFSPGAGAGP